MSWQRQSSSASEGVEFPPPTRLTHATNSRFLCVDLSPDKEEGGGTLLNNCRVCYPSLGFCVVFKIVIFFCAFQINVGCKSMSGIKGGPVPADGTVGPDGAVG